jgi:(1->4)-alpha-D-glucan 1-alpha-D-glucosylmutase
LRAQRPNLFATSARYEGLTAQGLASTHVVAFKRGEDLIAVAPRLVITLHEDWRDTTLTMPRGTWYNELTGETLPQGPAPLSIVLRKFPVALLLRENNA